MINASTAYKEAVVASGRRSRPRVVADITDPDLVLGTPSSSPGTVYSDLSEIINHSFNLGQPCATAEVNRWVLDGTFPIGEVSGDVGFESEGMSDGDGVCDEWVLLPFSGVNVLQNLSVYFSDRWYDGIPRDFTVKVLSGNTVLYSETIVDNESSFVKLGGFTAYLPTAIRVEVTKWSLPYRRVRLAEIIVGIYEIWGEDDIAGLSVEMQTDFSLLSLPFSNCTLGLENLSRRFDPRNKDSLFASLEERQAIQVLIGMDTADGVEYVPVGTYYQYAEGWKTRNNASIMSWYLVDMIGLLQKRKYDIPAILPTTLEGWVASIVAHLGSTFSDHYEIAEGYGQMTVEVSNNSTAGLVDRTCGQVLLWLCQIARLFPRTDPQNGYLRLDEYWDSGSNIDLDNLVQYPTLSANGDIAELHFKLPNGTEQVVYGNSTTSPNSATVENPFVKNSSDVTSVGQYIVSTFGGNVIETMGRGDPTAELGDVVTVELDRSVATTGRLCYQMLSFKNGVLRDCKTKILQPGGIMLYTNMVQFTESGTWTVPEGVTSVRVLLVGQGENGGNGEQGEVAPSASGDQPVGDGTYITYGNTGARGADGLGGKVWSNIISVTSGATYSITIGSESTFANYSSENGVVYPGGYADINSGESFARTGINNPIAGSGDGGRGGAGGAGGVKVYRMYKGNVWKLVQVTPPSNGSPGSQGATGCCVIYWEDAEA